MAEDTELKIQLEGSFNDEGHVRLSDFLVELQAIQESLAQTDKFLSGSSKQTTAFRVVGLSHNSPAALTIEAFPSDSQGDDRSREVLETFVNVWQLVNAKYDLSQYPASLLTAFRKIADPMKTNRVLTLSFSYLRRFVTLVPDFATTLSTAIDLEQSSEGSMMGMLESINLHDGANRFRIFPTVGPDFVICSFDSRHKEKARDALGHYVEVTGVLRYRPGENFPYEIKVAELQQLADDEDLPTLFDLHGIAPRATGDKSTEDFVEGLRDDEW